MGAAESRLTSDPYHIPISPSPSYNPTALDRDPDLPLPQGYLIDFRPTPLAKSCTDHYALIIDDCFTPQECADLISLAERNGAWAPALVHSGPKGEGSLVLDYRNSGRIMVDDEEAARFIYERVKPWLGEVERVRAGKGKYPGMVEMPWTARKNVKEDDRTWEMTRVNERLRFLKYGPGQEFKRHCDSFFSTKYVKPDAPEEHSWLTIQVYLADSPDLIGGATTFYGRAYRKEEGAELDIRAVAGRVLVFQQADLLHSGQLVKVGEKVAVRSDIMYRVVNEEEEAKKRQDGDKKEQKLKEGGADVKGVEDGVGKVAEDMVGEGGSGSTPAVGVEHEQPAKVAEEEKKESKSPGGQRAFKHVHEDEDWETV